MFSIQERNKLYTGVKIQKRGYFMDRRPGKQWYVVPRIRRHNHRFMTVAPSYGEKYYLFLILTSKVVPPADVLAVQNATEVYHRLKTIPGQSTPEDSYAEAA